LAPPLALSIIVSKVGCSLWKKQDYSSECHWVLSSGAVLLSFALLRRGCDDVAFHLHRFPLPVNNIATIRMFSIAILLTVLISSHFIFAENATTEDISNLAISGWWSDCIYESEDSCAGNYTENSSPIPLDPTGNTCYANPYVDAFSSTRNVVFWLGPPGTDVMNDTLGILLYTLHVTNDADMPRNCTDDGACSCESLEDLRSPWRNTSTCNAGCSAIPADNLVDLNETCAVLFKASAINAFFNDTIVTCSIQGSLVDLSGENPSASPTSDEQPTSHGTMRKRGWLSTWFVVIAYITSLS
jgi:hypothetical protein